MTLFPARPDRQPRLFGVPPGADFPQRLVDGLIDRLSGQSPEAIARVELVVNTTRMRRRIEEVFVARGAGVLPRIRLLTEMGPPGAPAGPSRLARRLELAQLVRRLVEAQPELAPKAAIFDLARSLDRLLDEFEGEGVPLEALDRIDVGGLSAHWARATDFIRIIAPLLADPDRAGPEARQRARILSLVARWRTEPPDHPVLVAGSTGSRGTTALLMEAVARLPQGALVLPGFDFDQPPRVWDSLGDALSGEDHPQFRFAELLRKLETDAGQVVRWHAADPPATARNALVSLALRPAPVTDQWLRDGPALDDLGRACAGMTLVEAPSPRLEAQAIALSLRDAAAEGKTAALVTPDRVLARQVTAALDRWRIYPDDSAGRPLHLSPPGRLLRQVAHALGSPIRADALIALLKHPLAHGSEEHRGTHLLLTRELELHLRRKMIAQISQADLHAWAAARDEETARPWAEWLGALMVDIAATDGGDLVALQGAHRGIAERLARGLAASGSGALWEMEAGRKAMEAMDAIADAAPFAGDVTARDYATLLDTVLTEGTVRESARTFPGVMILGTLEARVQTADLVILGGLNDGIWPALPDADPWMNRTMRAQVGLLLPERRIGLSAHDFQQAIGAREVILTRAIRDGEAETVPSRWLNRLTYLLNGLGPANQDRLVAMRARGTDLIARAGRLDQPDQRVAPAGRPSPRPPVTHRPREMSVTAIEALIRDPYTIYARQILRLRPLDTLGQDPDARTRGTILHKVMETFLAHLSEGSADLTPEALIATGDEVIAQADSPPEFSALWLAHLARIAADVVSREQPRHARADSILTEQRGARATQSGFRLTCRADRLDLGHDGQLRIYDYKSNPPTKKQLEVFDFQLHLEAAIAAGGGFSDLGPQDVAELAYISLGTSKEDLKIDAFDSDKAAEVWERFCGLIEHWLERSAGYTARRMMKDTTMPSDYDHLSRYGEWEMTDSATPQDVP